MNVREIACPVCRGPLIASDTGLRCPLDRTTFPRHTSGLLDLRLPELRGQSDQFATAYRQARLGEGLAALTAEDARKLPDANPPGYPRLYWQVRRESWTALRRLLLPPAISLTIADLGAGIPWLSHRLATLGHRVVAVDLSPDTDFGLGAARHFPTCALSELPAERERFGELLPGRFLPVLGSLEHPPLAPCAFDAVICNASLHYAERIGDAVRQIAASLRPGAALFVVDSPLGAQPRPGIGNGRVLGREELDAAMRSAGLSVTWHAVPRGLRWRRHQFKNSLLRRAAFGFPLVEGRVQMGL